MTNDHPTIPLLLVAGAVGGLANMLAAHLLAASPLPGLLGVAFQYPLDAATAYKSVTWGGAWGLLFLVARLAAWPVRDPIATGAILGIAPWLALSLLFLPMWGAGPFGVGLGALAPVILLPIHVAWGLAAGAVLRAAAAGRPAALA